MRLNELEALVKRRRFDAVLVCDPANVRALTGVNCDNAVLEINNRIIELSNNRMTRASGTSSTYSTLSTYSATFYTDFRYIPMVHRVASSLKCRDLKKLTKIEGRRIGYESSMSHAKFLKLQKLAPRGAKFVDVARDLLAIRAVKTPEEIERIRAAEALACEIWNEASAQFRAGMTERDMARIIQKLMIEKGEGEAFATIVCVGKNAAECHHEPDDTVWNGREPVLVDMGVKFGGVCSDLTRNLAPGFLTVGRGAPRPPRQSRLYKQVYSLVKEANAAAIAAARPGMTGRALDKVARDVIKKGGFGKCFGHSLGHGVGYEIHEAPNASTKSDWVLKPGMCVTIEPGVYLEDNLGVRIEDLVLITETGCEVLSTSASK